MKILVTGGCGFAGSEVIRALLERREGLEILVVDNFSRPGSEGNIDPLCALGCDVRAGDVRDRAFLESLPRMEWILDAAANPSVLAGIDAGSTSRDLVDQNLYATVNLLELCKTWSAAFTLLSTSRVYSIPALCALPAVRAESRFELPDGARGAGWSAAGVTEDFSTAPPLSLYGSTKRCSELLALEYGLAFGFPVWINRCGVLAGAGQFGKADQGIFSYWIHSWRAGRPLRYIGFGASGCQVRDCLHPRDLVDVLLAQVDWGTRPVERVLNLAGGAAHAMSLKELSAWCAGHIFPARLDADPQHLSDPSVERPFDIPWAVLDCRRAREIWGWKPSTPISRILEEIAAHSASHPNWLNRVAG